MQISVNLNPKVRIKLNDRMIKQEGRFVYLQSEINSEGKLNRKIKKISNLRKEFYEAKIPKQCITTIYKVL
jgi:hypothetical protein